MKTKLLIILFLFASLFSFSQQLTYKSGGNIYDSNNKKISPAKVRELLATKPGLLNYYNEGRAKKTTGNVLLVGGLALFATDFGIAVGSNHVYPTVLTYLSITSVIIAIPVKIGFAKKIKTVVKDYNAEIAANDSRFKMENMSLVTNQNGIGIQMTF